MEPDSFLTRPNPGTSNFATKISYSREAVRKVTAVETNDWRLAPKYLYENCSVRLIKSSLCAGLKRKLCLKRDDLVNFCAAIKEFYSKMSTSLVGFLITDKIQIVFFLINKFQFFNSLLNVVTGKSFIDNFIKKIVSVWVI